MDESVRPIKCKIAGRILSRGLFGFTTLVAALSTPVGAQTFSSGSNGTDGALTLTTPGDITFDPKALGKDKDGDGIFHFTTITIGAGVIVKLSPTHVRGPVFWLATGDVQIAGTIDLNGEDGQTTMLITKEAPRPAVPGSGGFPGGVGGTLTAVAEPGSGPGGGKVVGTLGGPAGHAKPGESSAFGISGAAYGNDFLMPLIGGSGGGGSRAQPGTGGGAGGGALLIASSTTINVTGTITARGGKGQPAINALSGSGSGGSIYLVANTLNVSGNLRADGQATEIGTSSFGRIRLEAGQRTITGTVSPPPLVATPFGIFVPPGGGPTLKVLSVAGVDVPVPPTGGFSLPDVTISKSDPVTIAIEAHQIPPGTVVQLHLISETVPIQVVNSSPLVGTLDLSNATVTATIPPGFTRGYVRATWTP